MEESDLNDLSKVAGVDFNALRRKYKKKESDSTELVLDESESNESSDKHRVIAEDPSVGSNKYTNADQILRKYDICKACQGLGIIKTIYNFMTLEQTCEECEGESIILKEDVDKVIVSEHMDR
jgi:DnaJ-class molecular chaperone